MRIFDNITFYVLITYLLLFVNQQVVGLKLQGTRIAQDGTGKKQDAKEDGTTQSNQPSNVSGESNKNGSLIDANTLKQLQQSVDIATGKVVDFFPNAKDMKTYADYFIDTGKSMGGPLQRVSTNLYSGAIKTGTTLFNTENNQKMNQITSALGSTLKNPKLTFSLSKKKGSENNSQKAPGTSATEASETIVPGASETSETVASETSDTVASETSTPGAPEPASK